jgi:hypothetical protein
VKMNTHHPLVPQLRVRATTPPLPIRLHEAQAQMYLLCSRTHSACVRKCISVVSRFQTP